MTQGPHSPNRRTSLGKRIRSTRLVRWFRKCLPRDFGNVEKLKLFWEILPYTMCSYEKLDNVYRLAGSIEEQETDGAFVECGVWKGGCSAIMAYVAHKAGSGRGIWLFDSFEGLPEPGEEDGKAAHEFAGGKSEGNLASIDRVIGPLDEVKGLFSRLSLQDNVHFEKGWFQDTLPRAANETGPIAILRLDADWYESTMCCLENLYDNVIPGGYVIIDDFNYWQGSRKATEEFIAERNLDVDLIRIDYQAVYFAKP